MLPAWQTFSAGITGSAGHEDVQAVLGRAYAALFRAKELGRNRTVAVPAGESGTAA
jgi:PleD family two-component response regulator